MLFHSIEFLLFFSFFYSLYLTLPHIYQNRLLLVASYVFYGWWDWRFLSLILISTLIDYTIGLQLRKTSNLQRRKLLLSFSLVFNLGMLGFFKYYNFFVNYQKCDIVPLQYKDYNLAINGAKIALVFLSKLNNDTYTRRCFEIPATKTMMLSEFTNDLSSMFEEGVEAEYFRSKRELVDKINFYLKNDKERIKIGNNGNDRLLRSEHEAMDRCKQVLKYMKPQIF